MSRVDDKEFPPCKSCGKPITQDTCGTIQFTQVVGPYEVPLIAEIVCRDCFHSFVETKTLVEFRSEVHH